MDISDSYEPQQSSDQPQQQQQPLQQDLPQQQLMQYEPTFGPANGFAPAPYISSGQAIPLPAPPQAKFPAASTAIPSQPTSSDIDIDSLLLQQFSCLGTTDHEDLINQFQSLMNNQMNKDSARFYLEMSNWNLQTAVGCYLDFCNFQNPPSMKIVQHSRPSETCQAWRLQNDGTVDWPNGCYLTSPSQHRHIVPALKPGDTCDIRAEIPPTQTTPIQWHLCTPNGWNVGEPIWMTPPAQDELSERMAHLLTSTAAMNPDGCPQVNVVISINME